MDILKMILIEPFQHEFMQQAALVAVTLSILCGALGVLLVPRGLSMLGDGLAHATFGGVGTALLCGFTLAQSMWMAMPFAVIVALGIAWLTKNSKISGDAALGVFFTMALAVGVAALHTASRRGVGVDVEMVLFGNILGVQPSDAQLIAGISLGVIGLLWWQGPRIAYAGFYSDLAAMSGIRVGFKEYLLMGLTGVVTVLAVHAVGVLLVSAWLVIPAVIGRIVARRMGPLMVIATLAAILGSFGGLIASYHYDIPSGSAMTLALGVLFMLSLAYRGIRG